MSTLSLSASATQLETSDEFVAQREAFESSLGLIDLLPLFLLQTADGECLVASKFNQRVSHGVQADNSILDWEAAGT